MWHQPPISVGTLLLSKNTAHFLITLPLATPSPQPRVPSTLPPAPASHHRMSGDQALWHGEVKAQGTLAVKSEKRCTAKNETNPFL